VIGKYLSRTPGWIQRHFYGGSTIHDVIHFSAILRNCLRVGGQKNWCTNNRESRKADLNPDAIRIEFPSCGKMSLGKRARRLGRSFQYQRTLSFAFECPCSSHHQDEGTPHTRRYCPKTMNRLSRPNDMLMAKNPAYAATSAGDWWRPRISPL